MKPFRKGPCWQMTNLRQMLKEHRPQVYWGTGGWLPFPALKDLATTLTVHDLVYHFAPQTLPCSSYWGRRLLQPLSVSAATTLVAVSNTTAADIQHIYARQVDAVVIPPLDNQITRPPITVIQEVRSKYQLPSNYFLCLGTLEPRKNVVTLLQAHMQARLTNSSLPPIVLVGKQGWRNRSLRKDLEDGLETGRVYWLSYVPRHDLPALYAGCEAFLMPSIYEGFGMPIQEAQRCGAAVLHGNHSSMSEASAKLGISIHSSVNSWRDALEAFSNGSLPLVCRMPEDFDNTAKSAAKIMWQKFYDAFLAKK